MILSATGHRPQRLYKGKWTPRLQGILNAFAERVLTEFPLPYTDVITGGALGWDTALAIAAIKLGKAYVMAVPFEGQEDRWPREDRQLYHSLRQSAKAVVMVSPGGYTREKMMLRNAWMVDNSDCVLALWDGATYGGTFNCLEYAHKKGRKTSNYWDRWLAYRDDACWLGLA